MNDQNDNSNGSGFEKAPLVRGFIPTSEGKVPMTKKNGKDIPDDSKSVCQLWEHATKANGDGISRIYYKGNIQKKSGKAKVIGYPVPERLFGEDPPKKEVVVLHEFTSSEQGGFQQVDEPCGIVTLGIGEHGRYAVIFALGQAMKLAGRVKRAPEGTRSNEEARTEVEEPVATPFG